MRCGGKQAGAPRYWSTRSSSSVSNTAMPLSASVDFAVIRALVNAKEPLTSQGPQAQGPRRYLQRGWVVPSAWPRCYGRFARRSNPCQNAAHVFSPAARLFPTSRVNAQLRRGHRCSRRRVDRTTLASTDPLESQPGGVRWCRVVGLDASLCLRGERTALRLPLLDKSPSSPLVGVCINWRGIRRTCSHLIVRVEGLSLGTDAPGRLLYGVTVGPIVEEVVFRGAAFSAVYVTASSISGLARCRIVLSIVISSLFFASAHTSIIGIPWLAALGMGMLYALLRWRSNSTAAAALMHATYNAVIAFAMLRH